PPACARGAFSIHSSCALLTSCWLSQHFCSRLSLELSGGRQLSQPWSRSGSLAFRHLRALLGLALCKYCPKTSSLLLEYPKFQNCRSLFATSAQILRVSSSSNHRSTSRWLFWLKLRSAISG